jgi:NitT/TauT family transport system ATP-binding protein
VTAKVEVKEVTCRFGEITALEDASLCLGAGEFVSIVGPSGCGKTTLFNVVAGLIRPTEGEVWLDGTVTTGETGHVGYMLQKDLLVPWRSVLGNIVLGAALTHGVTQADRKEARELATRYGLGEFVDHYPHAISGGMRQRAALMRTLMADRDILLLDEPFGALDAQTRLDMQLWLLSVCRELGVTVLFVTHDVDEAIFLADRVVVMSGRPGRILEDMSLDTPRPRGIDWLTSSEFTEIKRRALALLHRPGVGETVGVA